MRQLILLCGLVTLAFGLGVNQEINFFSRAFYDDNIFMKADGSEKTDTLYHSHNITYKAKLFQDRVTINPAIEFRKRTADNQSFIFGSIKVNGNIKANGGDTRDKNQWGMGGGAGSGGGDIEVQRQVKRDDILMNLSQSGVEG